MNSYILSLLILIGQSGYAGSPPDCIYEALSLSKIDKNSIVFDIGSGDGRVCIIASKIYKCKSVGIEYDKNLANLSKQTVIRNKVSSLVEIKNEDALKSDLSRATHIYLYHQEDFLNKLRPQLEKLKKEVIIICLDYPLPWRKDLPIKILNGEDGHQHSIYVYKNIVSENIDSPLTKAGKSYPGVRYYEGHRNTWLDKLAQDSSDLLASRGESAYWRDGHPNWDSRHQSIYNTLGMRGIEVTAFSWPRSSSIITDDILTGLYYDWRRSPGHWSVINQPHKLYGDAIAKSKQNIYYATIIVAD